MPTILRPGPYRVYFYSHEPNEKPHVHIDRDDCTAKFWLEPVGLVRSIGFNAKELRKLETLIHRHQTELQEAWYEFFGR